LLFKIIKIDTFSKEYELIAEAMKLFGNSAYGKTITNKENFVSTTYGNEDNMSKKINSPHFKDLDPPSSVVVYTQGRESGGSGFETRSGVIHQALLL
jgi:hypothetical protein